MTSLICLLLLGSATIDTQKPSIIVPPPIESFDGTGWAKVTFGKTTDGELKKLYVLEKGAIRPEALKLKLDTENERIDVILDGRGAKAKAMAIRIHSYVPKTKIEDLEELLQEKAIAYYQNRRWEDWLIAAFPKHGILVQVLKDGSYVTLLCKPDRVPQMLDAFETEPTDVVAVDDPGRDWDRVVYFGRIYANVNLNQTNLPDELDRKTISDLEWRAEGTIRSATARGSIRYERGEDGRYEINVHSDKFNDKGKGRVYCDARFASTSPYGTFEVTSSLNEDISRNYRRTIQRMIDDTLNDLEREIRQKISKLGPPPPEFRRLEAENLMLDIASRKEVEKIGPN